MPIEENEGSSSLKCKKNYDRLSIILQYTALPLEFGVFISSLMSSIGTYNSYILVNAWMSTCIISEFEWLKTYYSD